MVGSAAGAAALVRRLARYHGSWWFGLAAAAAAGLPVAALADAQQQRGAPQHAASPEARRAFMDWMAQQGAKLDAVSINTSTASASAADNGLFATDGLKQRLNYGWLGGNKLGAWASGQRTVAVAEVPLDLAVTAASAARDPSLGPAIAELLALGVLDERTAVMLFLLAQRMLGEASRYAPWVALLPHSFTTPLWFDEQQMAELRGTSLAKAAAVHRRRLTGLWEKLQPAAADMLKQAGAQQQPTMPDFLWAYSVFWSRGQSLPVTLPAASSGGGGGTSSSGGGGEVAAVRVEVQEGIVPALDFANHRTQATCWWEVGDAGEAGQPRMVQLMTNRACCPSPGQELFISYGDKGNEELLMLYGFALPANPHETLMIACPLEPTEQWDAVTHARLALLQAQGLRPQFFLTAGHLEEHQRRSKGSTSRARPGGGSRSGASCLPDAAWRTLEAFCHEPKELAARLEALEEAEAEASSGAGSGGSTTSKATGGGSSSISDRVDRLGLDMAVLTTFVRLLELQLLQLEDEVEGTGPLERDIALLEAAGAGAAKPGASKAGTPAGVALPAWRQACIVYRAGQKKLVREYLVAVRAELQDTLAALQAAVEEEERAGGSS